GRHRLGGRRHRRCGRSGCLDGTKIAGGADTRLSRTTNSRRETESEWRVAGAERGKLGPSGSLRAPRDGGRDGRPWRNSRRLVGGRRQRNPVQTGGGRQEEGEPGELARPRSAGEMLPAWRAASDVL